MLQRVLVLWIAAFSSATVHAIQNLLLGVPTHRVPLRIHDDNSPYALAVSTSLFESPSRTPQSKPPSFNFLATQVWPSARAAASAVETHLDCSVVRSLCEFGCGPALPALTAASAGVHHVIATDVDPLALELVSQAAREQHLGSSLTTQQFDLLTPSDQELPAADLYLFSDVFESNAVARGAARLTQQILRNQRRSSQVWVFAQTDRAQREAYLAELRALLEDETLHWTPMESGPITTSKLWLCDVDETRVKYS